MVLTADAPRPAIGAGQPEGIGLTLLGQRPKRGIIGRAPSPERLLGEIEGWLAENGGVGVGIRRATAGEPDSPGLLMDVHPAAEPIEFAAGEAGQIFVRAITSGPGPGYHTYVCHLLRRLGSDLAIAWAGPESDGAPGDATRYFETGDRSFAERALLGWLHGRLTAAHTARPGSEEPFPLSLDTGTRFTANGALLTVLGPRDDTWLDAAIRRPETAIDVWPWWSDATDAHYLLNRALCLMWTRVRWRSPAVEGERELVEEVLDLLRRAHAFDPALEFPWREWVEVADLIGSHDHLLEGVRQRAASEAGPLVGYRRSPVEIEHEGWSLVVPGSFGERRSADEVWLGETGRSISLAAVATGNADGPMPAEVFLDQVAGQLGDAVLTHRRGDLVGRAVIHTESSSGIEVGVVDGFTAVFGSGAAIRVVFEDPADWNWALDMWRSLDRA